MQLQHAQEAGAALPDKPPADKQRQGTMQTEAAVSRGAAVMAEFDRYRSTTSMEATLRGTAWQPLVQDAMEHGLHIVDCFPLDKKDKKGRKERRERSTFVEEVLEELDAVQELIGKGPGKLLPESDVSLLARLLAEVMAIKMRIHNTGSRRIEDLDKAMELAKAAKAAMGKKGGRAGTATLAPPDSASASNRSKFNTSIDGVIAALQRAGATSLVERVLQHRCARQNNG